MTEETWDTWAHWCELITADMRGAADSALVFRGLLAVYRGNEEWIGAHDGGHLFEFIHRCYCSTAILNVRRHVMAKGQESSLLHLMDQVHKTANQLTFARYCERFPLGGAPWQHSAFGKLSTTGDVVSAELVGDHMEQLKTLGRECKAIADRTIAHLDKRGPADADLTLEDLADRIDGMCDLARTYVLFVTGQGWQTFEATLQFDWARIFDVPINRTKVDLSQSALRKRH